MTARRPTAHWFVATSLLALVAGCLGGSVTPSGLLTPMPTTPRELTIIEPANLSTVGEQEVIFRGQAPARSRVVRDIALAPDAETIADSSGNWAMVVQLTGGLNQLRFRLGDDRTTELDWIVTYDTSVAWGSPTPWPTQTAGPTVSPIPSPTTSSSSTPTNAPDFGVGPTGPTQEGVVSYVVDGDTIHVVIEGREYRVRYIGMDAPETVDPGSPVEFMGAQATQANRELVEGQRVILEKDVSETDMYGRLLRYVWLQHGTGWLLVNREIVRLGFASASSYPPDVKYDSLMTKAQRQARKAGRGLWGQPDPTPTPTKTPKPNRNCDASYPTVCIPPYPPDLDCGQIPFTNFEVLPPDPHGFDGDHDGIGCEA